MIKCVVTLMAGLALSFSVATAAGASSGSLDNFKAVHTYSSGQFTDVDSAAWYAMDIQAGYEYGLLHGRSASSFSPGETLTTAEAVKLAVSLHSIYYTGKASFRSGSPWYNTYITYALKNGILSARPSDLNAPVTRAVFAELLAKALPAAALSKINTVANGAIPDVSLSDSCGKAVYTLYQAGILGGVTTFGTFSPSATLTRAEAAAASARAACPELRLGFDLEAGLTTEELYDKCASAVFYLERYDSEGVLLGYGSGFFITSGGLAVTNYHVIDGASSAIITTADGAQYNVRGICSYDKTADLAVLQIDGSGFSYLSIDASVPPAVGTGVYTIGSPYGLINTLSTGIVSNTDAKINGSSYIQYSAPISLGSGGGPVLNSSGRVIGVSCLTVTSGQTLNFAVPIRFLASLSRTNDVPLISIVRENADSVIFYRGHYPVPDYGVFVGVPLFKTEQDEVTGVKTFYYKASDITVDDTAAVTDYIRVLSQYGFTWQRSYTNDENYTVDVYYNTELDISVHFGMDDPGGVPCRFVAIY